MAVRRDIELADEKLRSPCRTALASLLDHWDGLTLHQIERTIDNGHREDVKLLHRPAEDRWQIERLLPASAPCSDGTRMPIIHRTGMRAMRKEVVSHGCCPTGWAATIS